MTSPPLPTIAFVTYRDLPHLTAEDQRVCSYLQRHGVKTQAVIWDGPDVVWTRYDAIVVRSCWDYHLRPDRFAAERFGRAILAVLPQRYD